MDERVIVVDAADFRTTAGPESKDGPHIAIDAGVEPDAAEYFSASLHSIGKVAREVRDVRESLFDVPVDAIGAQGPILVLQDLAGWDEPETGVSVNSGGSGAFGFLHTRLALSPRFAGDQKQCTNKGQDSKSSRH